MNVPRRVTTITLGVLLTEPEGLPFLSRYPVLSCPLSEHTTSHALVTL